MLKKNCVPAFLIFFFAFSSICLAERTRFKNRCMAIEQFIQSKQVVHAVRYENKKDSTLFLLDIDSVMCTDEFQWRGHRVVIVKSGPLLDSVRKLNAHHLFLTRTSYYTIRVVKEDKKTMCYLHFPSTNILCIGNLIKINRRYYVKNVSSGAI